MARILIFGALNWDTPIYLSGPIQPGARLAGTTINGRLDGRLGGGGGNTGTGLALAGHHVAMVTPVTADETGEQVIAASREAGLDLRFVTRPTLSMPRMLLLIDGHGERVIIGLDVEESLKALAGQPQPDEPSAENLSRFGADAVYIRRVDRRAVAVAAESPLGVMEWPLSPKAFGAPLPVHCVITSADDCPAPHDASLWARARSFTTDRLEAVILTRSADGAVVFTKGASGAISAASVPTTPVSPVDTTGAGDCFAGGVLHGRLRGLDWVDAAAHACKWGAAAVTARSSIAPDRIREIAAEIIQPAD